MSLYAKKIDYAASDESGEFVALIMLSNKKGGVPSGFILYSYNRNSKRPRMIECPPSEEEAKKMFPYGTKEGFFSAKRAPWKITTFWLLEVSIGGSYKVCSDETWVKVGRPRPKRKKKKLLKFGELSHIHRAVCKRIEDASDDLSMIYSILDCHGKGTSEYDRAKVDESKVRKHREQLEIEKDNIRNEMKFVRDRHFATA